MGSLCLKRKHKLQKRIFKTHKLTRLCFPKFVCNTSETLFSGASYSNAMQLLNLVHTNVYQTLVLKQTNKQTTHPCASPGDMALSKYVPFFVCNLEIEKHAIVSSFFRMNKQVCFCLDSVKKQQLSQTSLSHSN